MKPEFESVTYLTDEGSALHYLNLYDDHPDCLMIESLLVERLTIVDLKLKDRRAANEFLKDLNQHVFNCEPCGEKLENFRKKIKKGDKTY